MLQWALGQFHILWISPFFSIISQPDTIVIRHQPLAGLAGILLLSLGPQPCSLQCFLERPPFLLASWNNQQTSDLNQQENFF